ncbi:cytochrome P450 [Auriscalpium vulgare]|uniref:Cytochrome P450 n=1 Tax=Auriscalpium vulgare TaxID=40419 RepID=A0ACB8R2B7_9AGAM|nr:cytochrome P450 [Auriscalpium vulgare]
MSNPLFILAIASAALAVILIHARGAAHRLPPGPRGDVIGLLGKTSPLELFEQWREKYGPVISFSLFKRVVVLNDAQATSALLDKRGDIFSSRPRLVVAHEILSGGMRGISMPYGARWRTWRKIQAAGMSASAALMYREHQTLESTVVLGELLADATRLDTALRLFATVVMLSVSYGRRVRNLDDAMVAGNRQAGDEFQRASAPGKYLVEIFPFLLYLPRPLQWFRPALERIRARDTRTYLTFYRAAKEREDPKPCLATYARSEEGAGMTEVEVAYAISAPFGAGIDTTVSTMQWALVCAVLHPDVAQMLQTELDTVIGRSRLPTFADEPALPYFKAFIKEVMRFRPVVPLAVPHATTADSAYAGYDIPAGTTVYGNIEALMKDPKIFPDPETFRPERFLGHDDFALPFGFGRRVCPGMHIGLQSVFIVVARILWAFALSPASGAEPRLDAYVSLGLTRGPAPFAVSLRARDGDVARILEEEGAEAERRLGEWEYEINGAA